MEIDRNKEFYVPALANAEGQYIGPRGHEHHQLGVVVLLFTTEEKLLSYHESLDVNLAFMDMLERAPEGTRGEDLNFGYIKTTVQDLLPRLHDYGVKNLWVDPEGPGGYSRVYPMPQD